MSTSSPKIESVLNRQPKPGEVGGALVGYAEAQRQQEPENVVAEFDALDEASKAFVEASGKPIGDLSEQDFYRLPVVLRARNMQNMTELHVVFKDPSMTGHWFNWKHKSGDRVQKAYMMGFTACTKDDLEACHFNTFDGNGSVQYGDLVLLRIPKAILWGSMYKRNLSNAVTRAERVMQSPAEALAGAARADGSNFSVPAQYVGSSLTGAQTADADYRNIDKQREIAYAQ